MSDWTPAVGDRVRVLPAAADCRQRQSVEAACGCAAWVDDRGHPPAAGGAVGIVWDVWDNVASHPVQVVFRQQIPVTDDRRICACPVPAGAALVQHWERYEAAELERVGQEG